MKENVYKKSTKIKLIILLIVVILITLLFVVMFFHVLHTYTNYDVSHDDFIHEELTFEKYESVRRGDAHYKLIYFVEYEKPFFINLISNRFVNYSYLKSLNIFDKVNVYYSYSSNIFYDYEISELSHFSNYILSLQDYIRANKTNMEVGFFVLPILILFGVILIIFLVFSYKAMNFEEDSKSIFKDIKGKRKIEFTKDGNVIEVYASLYVITLVINDKIVDQLRAFIATGLTLKGEVKVNEKQIPVKLVVGSFAIKLLYDGEQVAKKVIL